MPNEHIAKRVNGIIKLLLAAHEGGAPMASASKGNERELFIQHALERIIAPPFRIASGEVTDSFGYITGQLDIVIEYDNSISFASISRGPRLYIAEGVCAVIEVKSDASTQWSQVLESHARVAPLRRNIRGFRVGTIPDHIPHFLVGYKGWKTMDTIRSKKKESGLDGILILDSALLHCELNGKLFEAAGWVSLFGFFAVLQFMTNQLIGANPDIEKYWR